MGMSNRLTLERESKNGIRSTLERESKLRATVIGRGREWRSRNSEWDQKRAVRARAEDGEHAIIGYLT